MYLMDYETLGYRAFSYFINEEIKGSAQDIFNAVMAYIERADGVDLQHLYIDGSKFEAYHSDPFRAVNFRTNEKGKLICPNGREFHFAYRKPVKGNQYGRQEEYYTCEDCSGCPYAEKCKKTDKNRTVRINEELSSMHKEVLENLESIHGALLRMNRSIQAEGTFGIIKYDRWYKRTVRRGLDSVRLELFLVSTGHNLYKFHNKQMRLTEAA